MSISAARIPLACDGEAAAATISRSASARYFKGLERVARRE
jgi:hypothetical protein